MSYEYDVFFSYKRDIETDHWHQKVKDKILYWLRQELGRDATIFFDTEEIRTGAQWRGKIASALSSSRCIVCVWSPMYFRSQWCVAEWDTFEKRCAHSDGSLILPIRFHDGHHYPRAAQDRQIFDFSNYTSTIETFWETTEAAKFEKYAIKPFVAELAQAIENSPDFDPHFPLIETPDPQLIMKQTTICRPAP